uniref:Uncharacterized protein n=1 Tax=Arundo donax TaxID=35708 RepID=A0A0A9HLT0_ARUDO
MLPWLSPSQLAVGVSPLESLDRWLQEPSDLCTCQYPFPNQSLPTRLAP